LKYESTRVQNAHSYTEIHVITCKLIEIELNFEHLPRGLIILHQKDNKNGCFTSFPYLLKIHIWDVSKALKYVMAEEQTLLIDRFELSFTI